jgi:hypothetical protein
MHLRHFPLKLIPQPPINPASRDREHHDFWPGLIFVLIGLLVIFCGARHMTSLDTVEGNTAWEVQLVKSFTSGGLEYQIPGSLAEPPPPDDPVAQAKAAEQMARPKSSKLTYRVNTGAQNPCPT